jgi:hypothetical protein
MCMHAAAMMSPPQESSQVWDKERASETSLTSVISRDQTLECPIV